MISWLVFTVTSYSWLLMTPPSEQARSILSVVMRGPAGQWNAERDPRMHIIADLRREKFRIFILLYVLTYFSEIMDAILL